jgi:hypothetical protein
MGMTCEGRTTHCDNPNCQKQVDITGVEPKHIQEGLLAEAREEVNSDV